MTLYSSKTPRDLGCTCYWTDPSTWFYHYGAAEPGSQMEPNYECFDHFPHVQHNPPNPILVEFRRDPDAGPRWLDAEIALFGSDYSDAHINHARAVLTRLAAFRGES